MVTKEKSDVKAFPDKLQLLNSITCGSHDMHLVESEEWKRRVTIPSWQGVHTLVDWTCEAKLTQAVAFTGLTVRLLDRKYAKGCGEQAKVTLRIDGELVADRKPLKDCGPYNGRGFNSQRVLFQAINASKEMIGVFMPNGCIVKVMISGLKKTESRPIPVEITLDLARYELRD